MAEEFKPQYTFTDDRLNELKQLFPEAWEDGVFNVDTLKTLIGEYSTDNNIKEHFGLNWVGKQDARKIAAKPPTGTLKPCPGEGVNEDNTENIFIEGENLEVLKILRKSYMGKIKMIYIDPPYNTGNDFIYNDTFADSTEDYLRKTGDKSDEGLLVSNPKSSGKYHANWLSFMYPRLRLAKDLLKEDGVIFISIDDNEVDNLRLLCDEIFGEENFEAQIIPIVNPGGRDYKQVAITNEYLICFSRSDKSILNEVPKEVNFKYTDSLGGYEMRELRNRNPKFHSGNRPNLFFPFFINPNNSNKYGYCSVSLTRDNDHYIETKPFNSVGNESVWRWGKAKSEENISLNDLDKSQILARQKKDGNWNIYEKNRRNTTKVKSVWNETEMRTENGTRDFRKLMGKSYFDHPKPVHLIKRCIQIGTQEDDLILDFFAGSGTTAQAMFSLNKELGSNRKFIIVQLPENLESNSIAYKDGFRNISEISKERIKKAISTINNNDGLRIFKQNTSTIYKWQDFIPQQDGIIPDLFSKLELAFKNPLLDGTQTQDFITEIILQEGFPLTAKQEEAISGVFKITHEWVPYNLYVSMLQSFKNIDFDQLQLQENDHFICLDKAFETNDALKQAIDDKCKLFTI